MVESLWEMLPNENDSNIRYCPKCDYPLDKENTWHCPKCGLTAKEVEDDK